MTIGFIHPHKAFLPEITAYVDFFAARGINTQVMSPAELQTTPCDVEWHFMGQQVRSNKNVVTIHEYASASVPPFSRMKDRIKKLINAIPHYRIFNNEYVLKQCKPADNIPFGIRNYGVPAGTVHLLSAVEKKYDFVYVGTVEKSRRPAFLFNCFTQGALQNYTLLVLTRNYHSLDKAWVNASNISFKGPIPYQEIYAHIQQARFGINYMPDIIPYNHQTSYKFLDYAACHIPIVTINYAWVRSFQNSYGGSYFYLQPNLENFTWENVTSFNYAQPDLSSWTWEKQIWNSGVLEFLQNKFPKIKF